MSDRARFWFWIVALAVTCLILGAVLASAARAQAQLAELTVGDPPDAHVAWVVPPNTAHPEHVAPSTAAGSLSAAE
jgi:hypothetical protein